MAAAVGLALYGALAYLLAPAFWRHYEHQRAVAGFPMTTVNALGMPGDPLNVGIEGSREDLLCAMNVAGWSPADPITFASSLKLVGSVLLDRPYRSAPVSRLFYLGRRQDLAFEKPSGRSPDTRHHVRFWKTLEAGDDGQPVWLGSATFDRSVGISHYTGQVTHHIAPDVDAERDLVADDLIRAGKVDETYEISGVGPTLNGHNAGGDRYFTDGEILFARLVQGCRAEAGSMSALANPPQIEAKNRMWRGLREIARRLGLI